MKNPSGLTNEMNTFRLNSTLTLYTTKALLDNIRRSLHQFKLAISDVVYINLNLTLFQKCGISILV